jgi:hypothetical protein
MTLPRRPGMTLPLPGPLHTHQARLQELADLGYTDVWSSEANGADAFTPLALASVWAPSLRLGNAIVPVYTRGPGTLAQCVGSLAQAAPGRFVLGIETMSNSLDNTLRVGTIVPTDWVMIDIRVDVVARGFGHGTVYLWAPDGTLMAAASQSAIVRQWKDQPT